MNEKRGQITIFIILGVVLLLTISVVLYLGGLTTKERPKIEPHPVPTEFSSVDEVFKNCIYEVGKKAFVDLGRNGGYINPSESGFYSVDGFPTKGSALEVFPNSGFLVPYWRHLKSSDSCTTCYFENNIPLLDIGSNSIKRQVERFIEDNIDDCLDFSHLSDFVNVELKGDPDVDVSINEEDVSIDLIYFADLNDLANPGRVIESNFYSSNLDLRFKRVYDIAFSLFMNYAINEDFQILESFTLDMIDFFGSVDSEIPPRYGGSRIGFSAPNYWFKQDIIEEVKYILSDTIKYNRVKGSFEYTLLNSENYLLDNIINYYLVGLGNVDPDDLRRVKVDIDYLPLWDIYVDINPSQGGLVGPEIQNFGGFFPIMLQKYNFAYDISYPVLFSLEEVESFSGEGYTLQFAYEVNIRNNKPLFEENVTILDLGILAFDDPANRNSGLVTVDTIDGVSNAPLEDVLVTYLCSDESVGLGVTELVDNKALISNYLPTCLNGLISGFKENYFSDAEVLTSLLEKPANLTLTMYPLKNFNAKIRTRSVEKNYDLDAVDPEFEFIEDSEGFLHTDDELILIVEKESEIPGEDPLVSNNVINLSGGDFTIELTVGRYSINGMLMRHLGEGWARSELVIPDDELCVDEGLFSAEECFPLDGTTFNDTIFIGGVIFDEGTGFFEITPGDLDKDELTFYVYSANIDHIDTMEDVGAITLNSQYTIDHYDSLLPRFE